MIFSKISPIIKIPLLYLLIISLGLYRLFFNGIFRFMFLCILLYGVYYVLADEPFLINNLISSIKGLDKEYKIAFLGSGITIIGFIIAFHTATINWKHQQLMLLKSKVADEIYDFFQKATGLILDQKYYIAHLVNTFNHLHTKENLNRDKSNLATIERNTPKFMSTMDQLGKMSVEVHTFQGKYSLLLGNEWGLENQLDKAVEAFSNISECMYITPPFIDMNDPNLISTFLTNINISDCEKFLKAFDENYDTLNSLYGGIRGGLLSPIIGIKIPAIIKMIRERKGISEMINEVHQHIVKADKIKGEKMLPVARRSTVTEDSDS